MAIPPLPAFTVDSKRRPKSPLDSRCVATARCAAAARMFASINRVAILFSMAQGRRTETKFLTTPLDKSAVRLGFEIVVSVRFSVARFSSRNENHGVDRHRLHHGR